jgi:predicted SprT family Zn-dependent metalloprotease
MKEYGLSQDGWTFSYDQHQTRFGAAHYSPKQITMSLYLVYMNERSEVEETIRHEIAHALLGPGYGHSHAWKVVAKLVGSTGSRCYSHENVLSPKGRLTATCSTCSRIYHRHRQVKRNRKLFCGVCIKSKGLTGKNHLFSTYLEALVFVEG